MKGGKPLVVAIITGAVFVFGILVILTMRFFAGPESRTELGEYTQRELLLPDQRYLLPSVEDQVLSPRFYQYIDPDKPLDPDLADSLSVDIGEALEKSFRRRVEQRLEVLLFD